VDQGGGGTIAYILANYGMEVIDAGIALHNMHATLGRSPARQIFMKQKSILCFFKRSLENNL